MTTNDLRRQEPSPAWAGPTFLLGVDAEGKHHVFRRATRSIHVIDSQSRVHVTHLDASTDPSAWMTFVARELCGWRWRNYVFSPSYRAERLAGALR